MRDIKFEFIVKNNDKLYTTASYTIDDLNEVSDHFDIIEKLEACDCQLNESVNHCEGDCVRFEDAEIIGKRQYTGLKDKNGKEIYEGDRVNSFEGVGVMVWSITGWRLKFNWDDEPQFFETFTSELEVIGNIYENPELLKPKK